MLLLKWFLQKICMIVKWHWSNVYKSDPKAIRKCRCLHIHKQGDSDTKIFVAFISAW